MTEPSGRRRRSRSSGTSRWATPAGRSMIAVGLIGVVVIAAAGLSVALGGGGTGSTVPPSQATVETSFPAVLPVEPTLGSFPPVATGTVLPGIDQSPSPSPFPVGEVKAKRIVIERLGINLRIVEGDGIDAPLNKAAHYPGTGWPGGGTNIYVYGHAQEGMFLSLWDVKKGDEVVLTLVDDTTRTYIVAKVIPKAPWDAIQYLDPTPREQLTLQTSTSYHPTSPRFIAIAYPAP